jgi:chromosome partitioning protein
MSRTRTIAIAAQKGGVAKTTSCLNLGAELAAIGQRVLLVDMDPQGHLAEGFGIVADDLPADISKVLSDHAEATLDDVIIEIADKLWLAPSNIFLADLELEMVSMVRREDRLRRVLEAVQDRFDFILIDCPPSLGILTINAFSAADEVIVPMACEFYALLGVAQLFKSVQKMRRVLNPKLAITGILPTRNRRTRHGNDVVERAREEFENVPIFTPTVPELVAVANASAEGKALIDFAPTSAARLAYEAIAKELLNGTVK